ncbi:lipopolysaccharide biosynthesis protein [Cupriavidus sp. USMAA2-4]|uniref:lipopolysaccharide biosynthesis protein n=1 Tax=Cupriavidus sp. USMAA2-4 TaxID=876364 RepID=UPI000A004801|nr:lipopolysaccharide biosynthesis protein [Cupriavidus sp. USMAA2-4]
MSAKKLAYFVLGPIGAAFFGFLALPIMAWHFSVVDIGRLNVYNTFSSIVVLVFLLGFDQAYVREYHEIRDRSALFRFCFSPGFILLLAAFLIAFPFGREISFALYGSHNADWFAATAVCTIAAFMGRAFSLVVRMQERGLAYSISQILPKLLFLLSLLGSLIFGKTGGFDYLLASQIISLLSVVAIFGWNARDGWWTSVKNEVETHEKRRIAEFGLPLIGVGLASWGLNATGTVALRTYSDFEQLGVYSMSINFAGVATVFQAAFTTVWMPMIYKWSARGDDLQQVGQISERVAALIAMLFAIVGMFSWVVDFFLPPKYSEVKYIVVCMVAQPLFYTLSETTVVGIHIARRSTIALLVTILALALGLLVSFALVPSYGAAGAAVGNAVAFFAFFVARTEASCRVWRSFPQKRKYSIFSLILAVAVVSTLYGNRLPVHYSLLWLGVLVATIFIFLDEWRVMWRIGQGRLRRYQFPS